MGRCGENVLETRSKISSKGLHHGCCFQGNIPNLSEHPSGRAETYSEPSQTCKMELFAKTIHDFLAVNFYCKKLDLRCLTGFNIHICFVEYVWKTVLCLFLILCKTVIYWSFDKFFSIHHSFKQFCLARKTNLIVKYYDLRWNILQKP